MNEHQDGFHGWVKWVVVVAALITISNAAEEFIKGLIKGFNAYSPPARVERPK